MTINEPTQTETLLEKVMEIGDFFNEFAVFTPDLTVSPEMYDRLEREGHACWSWLKQSVKSDDKLKGNEIRRTLR